MFGAETRAWSLTTPSSSARMAALLDATPEPDRRTWLAPGPLAPVCRLRRDDRGRWLRLSPGDPRRGPGSADRLYVTLADGVVSCAQRPGPAGVAIVGGTFVLAWMGAALAGAWAFVSGDLRFLAAVPVVFLFRTLAETGRRLDERRYRLWLRQRLVDPVALAVASPAPVAVAAAVWTVPDGDCHD